MDTEDVLQLRTQSWLGGLLTAIGLILFAAALFCLAVQFQHNLGVHFFDVSEGVDNPLLLAVPLFTLTGISTTLVGLSSLAAVRNLRRVRSHGLAGKARVVAATPTAIEIKGAALLELEVIVELPGLEPYPATTRAALARAASAIEPGSEIPVRVDPKDDQRIVFVG